MFKNNSGMVVFICISLILGLSKTALNQENNFNKLAKKIINISANIKPGDVVVIDGGKHLIPFIEALAIEVQKAGGMPTIFLESDKVIKSFWTEVDNKYIEQEPKYLSDWFREIDVWFDLPSVKNPKEIYADLPPEKIAKIIKATEVIRKKLNDSGMRLLQITYPSKEDARNYHIDFETYQNIYRKAMNADYKKISETGQKLKKLLENSKLVRVISPSGTDFSFKVGDRPIILHDGIITEQETKNKLFVARAASLPGGTITFAPIESSANGKVVIERNLCNYQPMSGIRFEFQNGKLINFKADQGGDCFLKALAPYSGPKNMFGLFSIGLNSSVKLDEHTGDYRPNYAAGMVGIAVGYNLLFKGKNDTQSLYRFKLEKTTVMVDGKTIIKDGNLMIQ